MIAILKKYKATDFKWIFASNILESTGMSVFNLVFIIYVTNEAPADFKSWAITIVSVFNSIPALANILTGYFADRSKNKIRIAKTIKLVQGLLYLIAAVAIHSSFSIVLFGLLIIINLTSDLVGQYSVGLLYPMSLKIIESNDRERLNGLQSGIIQTVIVSGQFIGTLFLSLMNSNYAVFSILNGALFFSSFMMIRHLKEIKIQDEIKETVEDKKNDMTFGNAIKNLFAVPLLGFYVSIYSVGGLIGVAIEQVFILYFANNKDMQIGNMALTITLMSVTFICGEIIGNILTLRWFEKQTFTNLIFIQMLLILLLIIFGLLKINSILILVLLMMIAFIQGNTVPKLNAWLMNNTLPDNIALSLGVLNTTMSFMLPIGTLIFMSIASMFGVAISFICMAVYSVILLAYIQFVRIKERKLA
ncbi:MAG: MFS transporter [Lactobacillaceae bacterium]|jgi:MFS family permease|nr:MFS transporter [Lactobacillaceae bacterium]